MSVYQGSPFGPCQTQPAKHTKSTLLEWPAGSHGHHFQNSMTHLTTGESPSLVRASQIYYDLCRSSSTTGNQIYYLLRPLQELIRGLSFVLNVCSTCIPQKPFSSTLSTASKCLLHLLHLRLASRSFPRPNVNAPRPYFRLSSALAHGFRPLVCCPRNTLCLLLIGG